MSLQYLIEFDSPEIGNRMQHSHLHSILIVLFVCVVFRCSFRLFKYGGVSDLISHLSTSCASALHISMGCVRENCNLWELNDRILNWKPPNPVLRTQYQLYIVLYMSTMGNVNVQLLTMKNGSLNRETMKGLTRLEVSLKHRILVVRS